MSGELKMLVIHSQAWTLHLPNLLKPLLSNASAPFLSFFSQKEKKGLLVLKKSAFFNESNCLRTKKLICTFGLFNFNFKNIFSM